MLLCIGLSVKRANAHQTEIQGQRTNFKDTNK